MRGADPLHFGEAEVPGKLRQHFIRENGENLVGDTRHQIRNTQIVAGGTDLICQLYGVICNGKIQIIRHQSIKLNTQQAALGQHTAVLLDEVTEILLQGRIGNDHSLTEESTYLCAANVEHIAQTGNIRHGHIITLCH